MMDSETKASARGHLRRIAGQVQAVETVVEADRYVLRGSDEG